MTVKSRRCCKLCLCALMFASAITFFVLYNRVSQNIHIEIIHTSVQEHIRGHPNSLTEPGVYKELKEKRILLYNPKHWELKMYQYFDDFWENCPHKCEITSNRSLYAESDAVVFVLDLLTNTNIPPKRKGQVWIFSEFESTDYLEKEIKLEIMRPNVLKRFNNKVNWTWTYRRDSDFPFVHGRYSVKKHKQNASWEDEYVSEIKRKTKTVGGFVSHCYTLSRREKYIGNLKKYVSVDIYGGCGHRGKIKDCPQRRSEALIQAWGLQNQNKSSACFKFLDKNFKFYLSFENSLCVDYITEKGLHHIVQHNIIPVMRSGANHSIFNPPDSYIDANQFDSEKELGKYLNYLQTRPKEMLKFHKWKQFYDSDYSIENWRDNVCNICKRLHNQEKYFRLYNDLYEWLLLPNGMKSCRRGA